MKLWERDKTADRKVKKNARNHIKFFGNFEFPCCCSRQRNRSTFWEICSSFEPRWMRRYHCHICRLIWGYQEQPVSLAQRLEIGRNKLAWLCAKVTKSICLHTSKVQDITVPGLVVVQLFIQFLFRNQETSFSPNAETFIQSNYL